MKRYPLLLFFVLTFAFSWPIMIVDAFGSQGIFGMAGLLSAQNQLD